MALKIKAIDDPAFATYGRALSLKTQDFLTVMDSRSIAPSATVVYDPSLKELESLALFDILQKQIYGGLPIEFGHCSGWNSSLNALEYHRSSEIDIAATDLVLMLGREQDIDRQNMTYDTANVECFLIPRGTAVEIYATTLHYAPCGIGGGEFRMGVVLPEGTNLELQYPVDAMGENRLLQARNKWLMVHPDCVMGPDYCYGLRGLNLTLA